AGHSVLLLLRGRRPGCKNHSIARPVSGRSSGSHRDAEHWGSRGDAEVLLRGPGRGRGRGRGGVLLVFWRCGDFAAWSGILVVCSGWVSVRGASTALSGSGAGRASRVHSSRSGPAEPGTLLQVRAA